MRACVHPGHMKASCSLSLFCAPCLSCVEEKDMEDLFAVKTVQSAISNKKRSDTAPKSVLDSKRAQVGPFPRDWCLPFCALNLFTFPSYLPERSCYPIWGIDPSVCVWDSPASMFPYASYP